MINQTLPPKPPRRSSLAIGLLGKSAGDKNYKRRSSIAVTFLGRQNKVNGRAEPALRPSIFRLFIIFVYYFRLRASRTKTRRTSRPWRARSATRRRTTTTPTTGARSSPTSARTRCPAASAATRTRNSRRPTRRRRRSSPRRRRSRGSSCRSARRRSGAGRSRAKPTAAAARTRPTPTTATPTTRPSRRSTTADRSGTRGGTFSCQIISNIGDYLLPSSLRGIRKRKHIAFLALRARRSVE